MDENLHNIDNLFKKAINEHDELPSENVWEKIDKNLDKKKVVFISRKYNKLKWIAAALLMFSAGMAMYTWHTKMLDKELVKQNSGNVKKQVSIPKRYNKDSDTNIASTTKSENKSTVKDTAPKIMLNRTAGLSVTADTDVLTRENKNTGNIKTSPEMPENLAKQSSVSLAETSFKNRKNKDKTGKTIAAIKEPNSEKAIDSEINQKGTKMMLYDKTPNVTLNNNSSTLIKTWKEVAAKTEIPKNDFRVSTSASSLQNSLEVLSQKRNTLKVKEIASALSVKINKKAFKKPLFFASVFYSPDLVSKKIDNDRRRFLEDNRDEFKNKEEVKTSYSAGVLITYNAWKKLSVESGIIFSAMSTDIRPKLIYARPDERGDINFRFNCSAGYSYIPLHPGTTLNNGDSAAAFASKNILHYIAVPLTLKYTAVAGKLSLNPGLGIAFNFLTKGKIETVINGVSGDEKLSLTHIEGLNSMYVNSVINLGVSYDLNKNLALSFTPAARFALTSINKNTPVKTFINSYGLAAGVTIKL